MLLLQCYSPRHELLSSLNHVGKAFFSYNIRARSLSFDWFLRRRVSLVNVTPTFTRGQDDPKTSWEIFALYQQPRESSSDCQGHQTP